MEVVEGCNEEIVKYFGKFEGNKNYEFLMQKFKELTKLRLKGTIELNEHKIPDIGPSDELENFPDLLKEWHEQDVLEIKNIIKLYDTGEIESLEEAIILIHVLKRKSEDYPKVLDIILNDLENQEFKSIEKYDQLLEFGKNQQDSIIYSGLWNFFMTLLC